MVHWHSERIIVCVFASPQVAHSIPSQIARTCPWHACRSSAHTTSDAEPLPIILSSSASCNIRRSTLACEPLGIHLGLVVVFGGRRPPGYLLEPPHCPPPRPRGRPRRYSPVGGYGSLESRRENNPKLSSSNPWLCAPSFGGCPQLRLYLPLISSSTDDFDPVTPLPLYFNIAMAGRASRTSSHAGR